MRNNLFGGVFLIILIPVINACGIYNFSGAALPPEVKSVTVQTFPNEANLVVPTLSQTFSEKLKDKFLRETNLQYKNHNGDLKFSGAITQYSVSPAAVQANERAGLSKLQIAIQVKYENKVEPANNFERTFSAYENFDSNRNLSEVEDRLIEKITDQLVVDIFNASINNW